MCCYSKNSAIALFDSGVGGVTIMREIAALLPYENVIYYADAASCPYGGRSAADITFLSERVVDFLRTKDVKIIVVACNTATTNAITNLRKKYPDINFIGTEPAVKPAVVNSKSGVIGVLATKSTISSHQIAELSRKYGEGKIVLEQAGDGLVELIEDNKEDSKQIYELLSKYINPMLDKGIDYLVLGCTHYPFMINTILKVIGDRNVTVINPAPSIARRVKRVLEINNLLNDKKTAGEYHFYSSLEDNSYIEKLEKRFNKSI